MILKLYDLFNTDTLRHRETARKVVELLNNDNDNKKAIDFDRIDFASRSFLHELLNDLGNKKVSFLNTNDEIRKMMDIARRNTMFLVA